MDRNIQEALKWVYASLGGDISELAAVDDIAVILYAIAALDTVKKLGLPTSSTDQVIPYVETQNAYGTTVTIGAVSPSDTSVTTE